MAGSERRAPIMKRIISVLSVSVLALAFAAPAFAAQNDENLYPPPLIDLRTPNAQIRIIGHNFGPNMTITITTPGGTRTITPGGGQATTSSMTVTTADDGSFAADVAATPDDNGEVRLLVAGVDSSGAEQASEIVVDAAAPGATATSTDGNVRAETVDVLAAGSDAAVAMPAGAEPAVSILTPMNALLAGMLVLAAIGLLTRGPARRRALER
jgi:hypothetical protein